MFVRSGLGTSDTLPHSKLYSEDSKKNNKKTRAWPIFKILKVLKKTKIKRVSY